jgi:hypothetical protein
MDNQGKQYLELLEDILELKVRATDNINSRLKNIYMRVADYIEETSDVFEEFIESENAAESEEEEDVHTEDDDDHNEEDPYRMC